MTRHIKDKITGSITNADVATYVKDSYNGNNLNITYGKSGQSSTSWLASWNGTELGAISPNNITAGNASKVGGLSASTGATKSTVVARDSNNYVNLNYINSNTSNNENPTVSQIIVTNGNDNYYRKASLAHLKSSLGSMPASDVYSWAKASTKPSYSWSEIGSKPSTFAPSAHSHSEIVTDGDNRAVATKPSDYPNKIKFAGLKNNSTINSPSGDTYSYVVGMRGWSDNSGGNAYEFAVNNSNIAFRTEKDASTWNDWNKVYTTSNKPSKSDVGLGNVENKSSATIRGELTKANVTTALGYTPPTSDTNTWQANTVSQNGYVTAPTTSNANKVWKTDANGVPGWRADADTNTWRGVQNNLTSTATDQSLSAYQGKVLNDKFASYVPTSRTVNGKVLSANISLSASDVGAASSSHTHNYAASSSAGGNANWANGATYANYSYNDKPVTTGGTGSAYTASVSGLTLVTGASFVMVPNVVSTTTAPTLNVNSLGAKTIRMRISSSTSSTTALPSAAFLTASKPVRVMYDGTYWVIEDMVRPDANNLYGTIISRGTTDPTSATSGYIYIKYA